jgi:hypothetical protein
MSSYPEILVSHSEYQPLNIKEVSSFSFIRRTNEDIYRYLGKYSAQELIEKIIPRTPKRDFFVFSLSLYGYFESDHIKIILDNQEYSKEWNRSLPNIDPVEVTYHIEHVYPLYFMAQKLFERTFKYNNEIFLVSFEHKPIIANYWHFQLFTQDSNGSRLPREPKPGEKETLSQDKKLKKIATAVFEYLLSKAICYPQEAEKYRNSYFEHLSFIDLPSQRIDSLRFICSRDEIERKSSVENRINTL